MCSSWLLRYRFLFIEGQSPICSSQRTKATQQVQSCFLTLEVSGGAPQVRSPLD